jgi:hypothetical protein
MDKSLSSPLPETRARHDLKKSLRSPTTTSSVFSSYTPKARIYITSLKAERRMAIKGDTEGVQSNAKSIT